MQNEVFFKSYTSLKDIEWDAYVIPHSYPQYCISYNVEKNNIKFMHDTHRKGNDASYRRMLEIMFSIVDKLKTYAHNLRTVNNELSEICIYGYIADNIFQIYDIKLDYKRDKQCIYLTSAECNDIADSIICNPDVKFTNDMLSTGCVLHDTMQRITHADDDDIIIIRPTHIVLYSSYNERIAYNGTYKLLISGVDV